MCAKVNNGFGENHVRVLEVFTDGYDKEFYIREVERLLSISSRTSQLLLDSLEQKNILVSQLKGKIRNYKINPSFLTKEYFVLAEVRKRIKFLEKNLLIKEILEKVSPFVNGLFVVFGSYAKGIQKDGSDLDVLVVGDYDPTKFIESSKLYGVEVSVKQYSKKIFEKELRKDIFLKEVLNNHVIIKGVDEFVNEVLEWQV